MKVLTETKIEGLEEFSKGKVRDTYVLGEDLLMVATDRLSAFDVVFSQGIPYKGAVLTEISRFWFEYLKNDVKTHIKEHLNLPEELREKPEGWERRSMRVVRAKPIMLECIVRGYLVGSGWREYQKSGTVCDIKLPEGLQLASKLPEPLFTPSTKAEQGEHDENVSPAKAREIIGAEIYDKVEELSLKIYKKAADYALSKGIILADTKFEFGLDSEGEVILIDEVLTPDSSRYWPLDGYEVGKNPPSFDKQYVRDYVSSLGWDKQPPAPELPEEVIKNTTEKYIEVYERLVGEKFVR